jgi:hypothetical protein
MPTPLFPPDYPHSAARPLEAFGLAFAEEISRSTMAALFPDRDEDLSRTNVQFAAGLTMLEGMHPRDHLECMFAAQGVAFHASAMDCLGQAMFSDTPLANANKLRASAAQMQRAFSKTVRDLKWLQASPLMERPGKATPGKAPPAEATPGEPPDDPPPSGPGGGRKPRSTKARPAKSPAATSTPLAPEASAADFPAPDPELSALAQEAETEEIS